MVSVYVFLLECAGNVCGWRCEESGGDGGDTVKLGTRLLRVRPADEG